MKLLFLWCCNYHALPLLKVSIRSALTCGVDIRDVYFAPMDRRIREAVSEQFPGLTLLKIEDVEANDLSGYADFGTSAFAKLSFYRYVAIRTLLETHSQTVLYIDADIVFLRDPRAFLERSVRMHSASLFMQDDSMITQDPTSLLTVIEPLSAASRNCCTGFTMWRPNDQSFQIIQTILSYGVSNKFEEQDQHCFNQVKPGFLEEIHLLPRHLFPNGSVLATNALKPVMTRAYIFHSNYMVGHETKEKRLLLHEPLTFEAIDHNIMTLAADPGLNIALNKPAMQSSIFSKPAQGGVNGDVVQNFGFETNNEVNPWWMVDLGMIVTIGRIIIIDREGFKERARTLCVLVSRDLRHWTQVFRRSTETENDLVIGIRLQTDARFVRCELEDQSPLHLAQVIVLAHEVSERLFG